MPKRDDGIVLCLPGVGDEEPSEKYVRTFAYVELLEGLFRCEHFIWQKLEIELVCGG